MVSSKKRRRWLPYITMSAMTSAIAIIGTVGVINAANSRGESVDRVEGLAGVLTPAGQSAGTTKKDQPKGDPILGAKVKYATTNYLIVGSDSRERADQYESDSHVGDSSDVGGQRSDVIMVLRQEKNGPASVLSIPRDLWTKIPDHKSNRVNAAYNYGPDVLTRTVTEELGIPINHYVEVDFFGFRDVIDALGGVDLCIGHPARDTHSGLDLKEGCQTLNGTQALEYARSRYYEEWDGSKWVRDPTGDKGRVIRQQLFIRAAVEGVLQELKASPFSGNQMLDAVIRSVRIDDQTDPIPAAQALQNAAAEGLTTFVLPTRDDWVGDAQILRLAEGSDEVLDYFAGKGPAPLEYSTGKLGKGGTPESIPTAAADSSSSDTTEP